MNRFLLTLSLLLFVFATRQSPAAEQLVTPGKLQQAINDAQPYDVLYLQPGLYDRCPYLIPPHKPLAIRALACLPSTTITPWHRQLLPQIVARRPARAFIIAAGADGVELDGLWIRCVGPGRTYTAVELDGQAATNIHQLPKSIVLQRLFIESDQQGELVRGIAADGANVRIRWNWIGNCVSQDHEAYAVQAFNTPGPLWIVDNYLEASGINVFLGGADSPLEAVPDGIEIARNDIAKLLDWKGKRYVVKHLIELKSGSHVAIHDNALRNAWANEGVGDCEAILLKPTDQNGKGKANTVAHVQVHGNWIDRVFSGIRLSGGDAGPLHDIEVFGNRLHVDRALQVGSGGNTNSVFALTDAEHEWVENVTLHDNVAEGNCAVTIRIQGARRFLLNVSVETEGLLRGSYGYFTKPLQNFTR